MRPGGVLQDPVPQPAHQVRQAPPQTSLSPHSLRLCDRTIILRETAGQSDHRDHHQGHAADRQLQLQLQFLHGRLHVVENVKNLVKSFLPKA